MSAAAKDWWLRLVWLVAVFGAIVVLAPQPELTDRDMYVTFGRRIIVPDCSDVSCMRVLIGWFLERFPGTDVVKWSTYAVLANAAAALAVRRLSLTLGLTARAADFAMLFDALGFGPLFAVFNPYTADPLMFALGAWLTDLLLRGRRGLPTALAAIGIFAKEFAAAPLWIVTIAAALRRDWRTAPSLLACALTVTLVWLSAQAALMVLFNYSLGDNPSADFLHGAYLAKWMRELSPRLALVPMLAEFGVLYLLFAAGLRLASADLRALVLASIPAALLLAYVQQPDRALWNFHFLVVPVAMLVVDRADWLMAWSVFVFYAAANLRFGAQLAAVPSAGLPMMLSFVLGLLMVVRTWRESPPRPIRVEGSRP